MKITKIGEVQTIMSNPGERHNYFAWPSVARLQDGRIAVAASGFRVHHVCPFGKGVIAFSENEGDAYTSPTPVINTALDDRDMGILTYGKSNVIVTSFNNTVQFQYSRAADDDSYVRERLAAITPQEEARDLGSTYRISQNCGMTFGPIRKCPVTSPHGPCELSDGSILWVGRTFSPDNSKLRDDCIQAYRIYSDREPEFVGRIDNITYDGVEVLSCEPHAVQLTNGRILCHIRVQHKPTPFLFTIYQSESDDGGRTWSKPHRILKTNGGAPAHIMRHSSGMLISVYGYRQAPSGIKVMFSRDNGNTWDADYDLYINGNSWDLGYPATVELKNGDLLTVFYARPDKDEPAVIIQQKWRFQDEI